MAPITTKETMAEVTAGPMVEMAVHIERQRLGDSGRPGSCRILQMKKAELRPAGIVALNSKAHLVRQVALELSVSYEEMPIAGEDHVIRFSCESMDVATTRKLVFPVPREAFVRRAIIGGGSPPVAAKETSGFASPLEF